MSGDSSQVRSKGSADVLSMGMNTNIFDYLETLPPQALDTLYGLNAGNSSHGQWTCRAILQSLPQLAKQHVMRLLFVKDYVERVMLKSWVVKEYHRVHAASVRKVRAGDSRNIDF